MANRRSLLLPCFNSSMEAPYDLCGDEVSAITAEPSSVPLPGEVRFPLNIDKVAWYDFSRYRTRTTLSSDEASKYNRNNSNSCYDAPSKELSTISVLTWNEFWSEIDHLCNMVVTAKKLDTWFWVVLLPIVAVESYRDIKNPQHSNSWEFWYFILVVPLVFIALDMWILQVDPDRALQETCRFYSPLFQAQAGYQVGYRKEWNDEVEIGILWPIICKRTIVRFIQFRPTPTSDGRI